MKLLQQILVLLAVVLIDTATNYFHHAICRRSIKILINFCFSMEFMNQGLLPNSMTMVLLYDLHIRFGMSADRLGLHRPDRETSPASATLASSFRHTSREQETRSNPTDCLSPVLSSFLAAPLGQITLVASETVCSDETGV